MALHSSPVALRELREILKFSYDELLSKLSVREIIAHSYEAGGVYPTLLGYAIGAIGTFCFFATKHPLLRLVAALTTLLFYSQCLVGSAELSSVVLLSFAAFVGVACTYVQVVSWQLAFAHVESRRQERKKVSRAKVVKEE